jgi:hypothetical protein
MLAGEGGHAAACIVKGEQNHVLAVIPHASVFDDLQPPQRLTASFVRSFGLGESAELARLKGLPPRNWVLPRATSHAHLQLRSPDRNMGDVSLALDTPHLMGRSRNKALDLDRRGRTTAQNNVTISDAVVGSAFRVLHAYVHILCASA